MSKTSRGFIWSFVEKFLSQGASFVIGIILARLIAPESYGLIVMVNIFITFSNIFIEGGFGKALMQKNDRSDADLNTAFIFNLGLSILIYFVLYLFAPFISSFYEKPELVSVIRVLGISLIISSLSIVPRALMMLKLDFKTQARVSFFSILVSGSIGVVMAYHGYEVWALVTYSLLCQFLASIGLLYLSTWSPKMYFSMKSFRNLFGYGSKLLLTSILSSLYVEGSNLIIGRFYSATQLAFYNRAFQLSQFPSTNVVGILNRVSFPIECEAQTSPEALRNVYFRNLHLSNFICTPMLIIFAFLSSPIIEVLLTERWLPAALYFMIFSINFLPYATHNETMNVISAVGKSDVILRGTIYRRIVSFSILFVSLFISVKAVCIGIAISSFIEVFIMLFLVKKTLSYDLKDHYICLRDILSSCIIISFVLLAVVEFVNNPYLQIVLGVCLSVILYLYMAYYFKMYEFDFLKNKVLKFLKR